MTPQERDHAQRVWDKARRTGRDPFELLNDHSLVLTGKQYHRLRRDAYLELADSLENVNIGEILKYYGASAHTAYDAQRVLTDWIRAHARKEDQQ